MNKAINTTPSIRFPEFTDMWINLKLEEFLVVSLREVPKPITKFLNIGVRSHFKGTFTRPDFDPSTIEMDTLYVVKGGDLVVNITFAWEGAVAIAKDIDEGGLVSHRFPTYTFNNALVIGNFFRFVYPTKKFKYELGLASPGGAGRNRVLNKKDFLQISFKVPGIIEQKKIADFLSLVDKKIISLNKNLELFNKYKKGLMQKLFTKEIRFKDKRGNEYPNWEVKTLKEISGRVTTKNIGTKTTFVLTNSATQGVVAQSEYFEKEIANEKNLDNYYVVTQDDFVYNPRISVSAPVGPIKRNHLNEGVMSPLYTVFKFKQGNLDFFEKYFETYFWHKYMKNVANYGARHDRMNITNEDFYNLPLPYPDQYEQDRIAEFLISLDQKIQQEESKLVQAKRFKKSLLQQMFI